MLAVTIDANVATTGSLGVVQIGENISISPSGVISVSTLTGPTGAASTVSGPTGPQGDTGPTGAASIAVSADQGSFYNTTTQTNPVASGVNLVTYNSIAVNVGITLVLGTQLTVSKTANYNLQFSVQLQKTTGPSTSVNIWIRRNNTDYPDTNTVLALTGSNTILLAGWSYILSLTAGDFVEIAWESPDTTVTLTATPGTVGPPVRPVAPSVRCTMVQLL
jgi:hypothetical protein